MPPSVPDGTYQHFEHHTTTNTNSSSAGGDGAYDLDQWLPSNCGGESVVVSIRGFEKDPLFSEAKKAAEAFAQHEACFAPFWIVECHAMTREAFDTWLKSFDEISTGDGAPVIFVDSTYVGTTRDLLKMIEEKKLRHKELLKKKSKTQRKRLCAAVMAICFVLAICYGVVFASIRVESSKDWERRLTDFYETHNPDKLLTHPEHVTSLLEKYKGREQFLWTRLSRKYENARGL